MKKMITFGFFSLFISFLHFPVSLWASGDHSGHSENKIQKHYWAAPPQAIQRVNPRQNTPESIHRGATLFKTYCAPSSPTNSTAKLLKSVRQACSPTVDPIVRTIK